MSSMLAKAQWVFHTEGLEKIHVWNGVLNWKKWLCKFHWGWCQGGSAIDCFQNYKREMEPCRRDWTNPRHIATEIEQIQTYRIDRVWQYWISKQMYAIFSQCSINTQDQPTTNRHTKIGTVNAPATIGYSIGGKWTRPTIYLNWLKYHKDTKYLNWLKTVKGQTWWKRGGGQIEILYTWFTWYTWNNKKIIIEINLRERLVESKGIHTFNF